MCYPTIFKSSLPYLNAQFKNPPFIDILQIRLLLSFVNVKGRGHVHLIIAVLGLYLTSDIHTTNTGLRWRKSLQSNPFTQY